MVLLGHNMTRASGFTKVMNFTSNIVALFFFYPGRECFSTPWALSWPADRLWGAAIGSGLAISKGARFIRPVFLTVIFFTIVRLGYQNYQVWF